jgi:hypothetical protein
MKQSEAVKLQAFLRRWRSVNPYRWQQGAQVVANDLMRDATFTDIKLAGLLQSPGGATVAQVVQSVLPFPANAEAAVLIEAIEIAAKQQTSAQVVGALAVGAIVALTLRGLFGDG